MRTRLNGLTMRLERPRARGVNRFIDRLLPTEASATTRLSTSRLWLFSALAIAEASTLRTSTAIAFFEKVRMLSASSAFLPRIRPATRLSFCAEPRICVPTASASLSATLRGDACLDMILPLALLVGGVAGEVAGRRELAELHAHHVLVHRHGNEFSAV